MWLNSNLSSATWLGGCGRALCKKVPSVSRDSYMGWAEAVSIIQSLSPLRKPKAPTSWLSCSGCGGAKNQPFPLYCPCRLSHLMCQSLVSAVYRGTPSLTMLGVHQVRAAEAGSPGSRSKLASGQADHTGAQQPGRPYFDTTAAKGPHADGRLNCSGKVSRAGRSVESSCPGARPAVLLGLGALLCFITTF